MSENLTIVKLTAALPLDLIFPDPRYFIIFSINLKFFLYWVILSLNCILIPTTFLGGSRELYNNIQNYNNPEGN